MDSKTYSSKNLKFIFVTLFLLILSVAILLYLFSLLTFKPVNESGVYNWLNISTVALLTFVILCCISVLLSYFVLTFILKRQDCRVLRLWCIKFGLILTIGVFFVILLNFFHILDIYWGLGILVHVIFSFFVI